MEISEIIWEYLSREYPDNHQVIYLYCQGNARSPNICMEKILPSLETIFYPIVSKPVLKTILKGFLDNKRKEFTKGNIKIISIYP